MVGTLLRLPRAVRLLCLSGIVLEVAWVLVWWLGESARVGAPGTPPVGGGFSAPAHVGLGFGLALAACGYVAALVLLDHGGAAIRGAAPLVIGFTLVFHATLWLMPGVFTSDVFSYFVYGQIGGVYGMNPYVDPPVALAGNPLLDYVYGPWQLLPSPYGPLWTSFSSLLAPLLQPLSVDRLLIVHKCLMGVFECVNLGLIWFLLGRSLPAEHRSKARLTGFAVFAWNPLLLLELAGNGHNDALMLTFLLASLVPLAIWPARASLSNARWLAWACLMMLSALVKYATLPVGLVGAVAWSSRLPDWRRRLVWLASGGLLAAGVAFVFYQPWYAGPRTLLPALNEIGGQYYFPSLPTLVQRVAAERLTNLTPLDAVQSQALVRDLVIVVFLGYVAWELVRLASSAARADEQAVLRRLSATSARILLVLLTAVLTEIHGWYFTWPLALVSLLGWRAQLTRLVVGYTLSYLIVDYAGAFDLRSSAPIFVRGALNVAYIGLPLLVIAGMALRSRFRTSITELTGRREATIQVVFRSPTYPGGTSC